MPIRYLLNTPILTAYGDYRFTGPLSVEAARAFVAEGAVSAIGHAAAAEFLGRLLGREVTINRITIVMEPGDQALVLRLKERLPEGVILDAEQMEKVRYELALLERTA